MIAQVLCDDSNSQLLLTRKLRGYLAMNAQHSDKLTVLEVTRRFPEAMTIENKELRTMVLEALQHTPEYFWQVPASSSKKYHNPWCRNQHGLWIHVKMAFTTLNRISDSYVQQGLLPEEWIDYAKAAVLLHDMFKQGMPQEDGESDTGHTVSDHDVIGAEWLEDNTDLPEPVTEAVHTHNGGWYDGRAPVDHDCRGRQFHLSMLVHTADMMASDPNTTAGLYKPAKEIASKYPNIPRAAL